MPHPTESLDEPIRTLLQGLTEEQRQAVLEGDGAALVIAGAGTGKTRVLTHRIAYLLAQGVPEDRILALTFTNKAADEMRSRIQDLLGWKPTLLFMGTFHSFAARILRQEAHLLGYTADFTIYDRDDQRTVLHRILKEQGLPKTAASWVTTIGWIKTGRRTPQDALEAEILDRYQQTLKANNAMDFDDLLLNLLTLFREYPDVHRRYAEQYQHILVDEYQDTNRIQFEILKFLSSVHGNLFVVGDEDQSIYGFRGADIRNVLEFQDAFPGARIFRLQQNFRSTQTILRAASEVIQNNQYRLGKTLWTQNPPGRPIRVFSFWDDEEEARGIAELLLNSDRPFRDFLILFRTNYQSRAFEEVFPRYGIPYEVVGTIRFYERKEIKDLIAYARFAVNPRDREAFLRIVNVPPRGLGPKAVQQIVHTAETEGWTYLEAMEHLLENGPRRLHRGLETLLRSIALLQSHHEDVEDGLRLLLEETRYLDYLAGEEPDPREETRRLHVEILLQTLADRKEREERPISLQEFVQEVALRAEVDDWAGPSQNKVTLMTVHTAKGLEFPVVIITGLEEGVFPHHSALTDPMELEEERRLLHVALTRAQEDVILTYAQRRALRSYRTLQPSRFLQEFPSEVLEGDLPDFDSEEPPSFKLGDRVYHPVFGEGYVTDVYEGKVEVRFRYGTRLLSLEYAKLKKI